MTSETDSGQKKLFLVDGSALAYRSHFAFIRSPLTDSKGRNVSAVFGFTNSLLKILGDENPDLFAVVFDARGPTFRHQKFEAYKATREKTPEELVEQLPIIKAVVEALGIPLLEVAGWEADDVIGTLARQAEAQGMQVFLVSGDKDFMQLVSDRVRIYNLTRPGEPVVLQGVAEVKEKFGVEPGRVIEVLALMGDASDNVPGVRGVGEKTALKLIQAFGSVEGLYANLDQVPGKALREKLEKHRDDALLSRELVTLDTAVPLPEARPATLIVKGANEERLRALFLELEFKQLLQRITAPRRGKVETERRYLLVDDSSQCDAFRKKLEAAPSFVIDTETTSLNPHEAELVGIAVSFAEGEAFYLPANLDPPVFGVPGADMARFLEILKGPLADAGKEKYGQNIKYDLLVLERAGLKDIRGVNFDTMVAHYLLHPAETQHGLDYLSLKYLNVRKIPTAELIGKGKDQITMAQVPVARVCEYACEDADMTLRLKNLLAAQLAKEGLEPLFRDIEMPMVRVLESMERSGVRVDAGYLKAMSGELSVRMENLAEKVYELAGCRFNINSTQQVGKVLFERLELHRALGIRKTRKTKTGYSTDASVLEAMAQHPLPAAILEHRQLKKLQSTYLDALPRMINPRTGRIHGSFNQTVTATGRLSSSDPNLQNIPIRTELGREIRKAFIPGDEGSVLLSADYSQIELRILAHASGDKALREAFLSGEDVHRSTAAKIFGVPPAEVTSEMRSRAKTINFGIIYGMGPQRLSRELQISFAEAQEFIASYFAVFSGVKEFLDRTLDEARQTGYVSTLLGRRRPVEEIASGNAQMRAMAENIAVNAPIQGTAADLIKKAMVDLHAVVGERKLSSLMILQVHDELLFDVPEGELQVMQALVREKMEGALALDVPIRVEMGWGKNWLEAHS